MPTPTGSECFNSVGFAGGFANIAAIDLYLSGEVKASAKKFPPPLQYFPPDFYWMGRSNKKEKLTYGGQPDH